MVGGALLMGRKKKVVDVEFPFLPVPMADFILYHEKEIRAAVCDTRAELTLLGASKLEGAAHGGTISDRTAAAACKLADELPCVVLDNGAKVSNPEKWLAVLDAVREKAKGCNQPSWILDEWQRRFVDRVLYIGETESNCLSLGNESGRIISWIRYQTLTGARERKLISFSDADICAAVEAAAG